jgi:hypothetical protein
MSSRRSTPCEAAGGKNKTYQRCGYTSSFGGYTGTFGRGIHKLYDIGAKIIENVFEKY